MARLFPACLALVVAPAIAGCVHREAPPRTTQVIVQPPAQTATVVSPGPPPAPQSELVPTPPVGSGPVVWQPGHWMLSGNSWAWQTGQYVPPPPGETTWVPGRWLQPPTGGWVWMEGLGPDLMS